MKTQTIQMKFIEKMQAALIIGLLACSPGAFAGGGPGGGGGGGGGGVAGPPPQIAGNYAGSITLGAPVIVEQMQLTFTEDAAGNLGGQICITPISSFVTSPVCNPLAGTALPSSNFSYGVFQFRAGDGQFNGIVQGPITCADGTQGLWLSGGVQARGAVSVFGVFTCS